MASKTVVELFLSVCLAFSGLSAAQNVNTMDLATMLAAVQNDRIQFATMRAPGSPFATLERKVVVTGPLEAVRLVESGEKQMLDHLVAMLKDRNRAWAAAVILAALTEREEKTIESFAAAPEEWWNAFGSTAYQRWHSWLEEARSHLKWDAARKVFAS